MKKPIALILISFLIFQLGCQKDYYLEGLEDAQLTLNGLKSNLNQINIENQPLINSNQQLEGMIRSLNDQLENTTVSIKTALVEIDAIEEYIEQLENQLTGVLADLQLKVENLLGQLERYGSSQADLREKVNSLHTMLEEGSLNVIEAEALYLGLVDQFAIVVGVQDGFYKTTTAKSRVSEEDLENEDFTLQDISRKHQYYQIEDKKVISIGIVRKHNDPSYFDNPYSSEPYLDKDNYIHGEYEIEVVGVDKISIAESIDVGGARYDVFHLTKIDSIPYNLTNEQLQTIFKEKKTGFFSDPIYGQVDVADLNSFLKAFIEDGKRYGRDMSWINPSSYTLKFDSFSSFIALNGYDPGYLIDFHNLTCEGGGRTTEATFRISKAWWDNLSFVDKRNLHIQVLWRIFANTLFSYDYFDGEGHLLSYGRSDIYQMTFDHLEEKYNFQEAAKKMFQGIDQTSWTGCTSKQNNPRNYSPKSNF